jgi:hypothetical protein
MLNEDFENLCCEHGLTCDEACSNLRVTQLVEQKSKLIVCLREKMNMTYGEIARLLNYADRSGARQAYVYGKKKINTSRDRQ